MPLAEDQSRQPSKQAQVLRSQQGEEQALDYKDQQQVLVGQDFLAEDSLQVERQADSQAVVDLLVASLLDSRPVVVLRQVSHLVDSSLLAVVAFNLRQVDSKAGRRAWSRSTHNASSQHPSMTSRRTSASARRC